MLAFPRAMNLERARPHLALLPAIALAAISVWEIVAVARAGSDVPSSDDWAAASEALRARRGPAELITVAPDWLDPVLRMYVGDLMTTAQIGRLDDRRYDVVWEFSARGAAAPERRGRERVDTLRFGELTLSKWRYTPPRVVTDFLAAAATAEINGRIRGARIVSLEEVGFEPRRCVKVVPRPNQTIEVRFPDVRLGTELVVGAGLADIFTRRDVRDPGRLAISIAGSEVARVDLGVDDGWVLTRIPTKPVIADVVFAATAVGIEARDRRVCFAAEAREPAR